MLPTCEYSIIAMRLGLPSNAISILPEERVLLVAMRLQEAHGGGLFVSASW